MTSSGGRARESGFTLVETIVALAIIGIVMAAVTPFLATTQRITRQQDHSDTAAQLATAAMTQVRSIKGSALVAGRDASTSAAQWNSPPAGVAPYLAGTTMASDPKAPTGNGRRASLPTAPTATTVGGIAYEQHYFVGQCRRSATTGLCVASGPATDVPLLKVVVVATWRDTACPDTCSYVTATLVDPNPRDPEFISP